MENYKIKMVFFDYYRAVLGRFYSQKAKKKILKLIAKANGIDDNQAEECVSVAEYIENEDIGNPVGCKNFLLVAFFATNMSPILYNAVLALSGIFEANDYQNIFTNELVWHRTIQKDNNHLDIGYYEYARGKLDRSIESFEKAMRNNKKLPLAEYIAIISFEAQDYKRAYEYALKSQLIDEEERLEIPWLMEIENEAKNNISETEERKIREDLTSKSYSSKIGF